MQESVCRIPVTGYMSKGADGHYHLDEAASTWAEIPASAVARFLVDRCGVDAVAGKLSLTVKDLFEDKPQGKPYITATCTYPNGVQKLRYSNKHFCDGGKTVKAAGYGTAKAYRIVST